MVDDTVKLRDEKMNDTTKKKIIARVSPRNPTEVAVTCQPYISSEIIYSSDGVMRNFSEPICVESYLVPIRKRLFYPISA